MRLLLLLLLSPAVIHCRVTFDKSEVLDNVDLQGTNTAAFRCPNGCRVFSPMFDKRIVITDANNNRVKSLNDLRQSFGFELPGGRYQLNNTGRPNPSFLFYAVEKGADYYDSEVISIIPGWTMKIPGDEKRRVTILSTTGAVSFTGFQGTGDIADYNYLPNVYTSGFDSISLCHNVFHPGPSFVLDDTAFTVYSPIATINFKIGTPGQYVTVTGDFTQSVMKLDASSVYTSPGYVGCGNIMKSVGDSLYTLVPPINGIYSSTFLKDSRGIGVSVSGEYNIANERNAIDISINDNEMKLYGKNSISVGYGYLTTRTISLAWTGEEGSNDAFALQFNINSDPQSATPSTRASTTRGPSTAPTKAYNSPSTRPTTPYHIPSTAPTTAYHIPSTVTTTGYHNPSSTATTTNSLPVTPKPVDQSSYCNCQTKFGLPLGWNFNDIWVDLVIILDTSEAMGKAALEGAESLIESFLSDGVNDFLVTDTRNSFYSRVGVISMADTPTTIFDLNMTNHDSMQGKATIKKGVKEIDVVAAFGAALDMFKDGLKRIPERIGARQVIYYMTDSDPKTNLDALNQFKDHGVVIVNNFLRTGEAELQSLKNLASDGYYFSNGDYVTAGLQAFCKANCFCAPDKTAYGGSDPAVKASGGCYRATPTGMPFNKAKSTCANEKGILATIHDAQKGAFLKQMMSSAKSDYFWIGYEKSDSGKWIWEDGSSDPYTNWDNDEPSSNSVAKCAYEDTTKWNLPWGAGNCQLGFPYVCQYAPCSVGHKDC